jgi:hypothetical protein
MKASVPGDGSGRRTDAPPGCSLNFEGSVSRPRDFRQPQNSAPNRAAEFTRVRVEYPVGPVAIQRPAKLSNLALLGAGVIHPRFEVRTVLTISSKVFTLASGPR